MENENGPLIKEVDNDSLWLVKNFLLSRFIHKKRSVKVYLFYCIGSCEAQWYILTWNFETRILKNNWDLWISLILIFLTLQCKVCMLSLKSRNLEIVYWQLSSLTTLSTSTLKFKHKIKECLRNVHWRCQTLLKTIWQRNSRRPDKLIKSLY